MYRDYIIVILIVKLDININIYRAFNNSNSYKDFYSLSCCLFNNNSLNIIFDNCVLLLYNLYICI